MRRFEAQLIIVELLEHKSIFSAGYTAILHCHAIAEVCAARAPRGRAAGRPGGAARAHGSAAAAARAAAVV